MSTRLRRDTARNAAQRPGGNGWWSLDGVSVCIPAYNEAAHLPAVIEEACITLARLPGEHEVLVVDDGSRDETPAVLDYLAARWPLLRVLRHPENRGLAEAQRTLIRAARGRYIFHIGADGQWRTAELERMLPLMRQGYDLVIGVRRRKCYGPWRRLVSWSYNQLVAWLWGQHFGDLGSLRLARAALWKQLPVEANSAFANAQRVLLAWANGARVAWVPVDHFPRRRGRSRFVHPWQAARAAWELVRFRFSRYSRLQVADPSWPLDRERKRPVEVERLSRAA